ncbi:MAG: hypothetical protein WAK93_06360 [Solirubrobacteraceae bacterium]
MAVVLEVVLEVGATPPLGADEDVVSVVVDEVLVGVEEDVLEVAVEVTAGAVAVETVEVVELEVELVDGVLVDEVLELPPQPAIRSAAASRDASRIEIWERDILKGVKRGLRPATSRDSVIDGRGPGALPSWTSR